MSFFSSKALLATLLTSLSATTLVVSSLVISNSGETPAFQDLNGLSLEDLREDIELPPSNIVPTTPPKPAQSEKPKTITSRKSSFKELQESNKIENLKTQLCGMFSSLDSSSSDTNNCENKKPFSTDIKMQAAYTSVTVQSRKISLEQSALYQNQSTGRTYSLNVKVTVGKKNKGVI